MANGGADALGGNALYFTESGAGADPGRVWKLQEHGKHGLVVGHVVVEGDWARLGRPDNLRFTDKGDLFIFEDHSATDFGRGPTGNVNQTWILPRHEEGSANMILFANTRRRGDGTVVLVQQQDPLPVDPGGPAAAESHHRDHARQGQLQQAVRRRSR